MNAVNIYRKAHWLYLKKVPMLPKILTGATYFLFHCYIPYTAKIGKGTKCGYGGMGVVIHARAEIGEDCIIGQQVTIGGRSKKFGVPRIGNHVYVACGAKVLGDITIGDNVVIGANAVVIHDVPANTVVAGVPAKIIKTDIKIDDYF